MPWGPGHHFYFTLPWHGNLTRGDYTLRLDAKKSVRHAGDGTFVPTEDVTLPVNFGHAGPERHDVHEDPGTTQLTFGPRNGEEDIRITFDSGASATVVVWTESEASPFYCVEPWACLPNAQANKFTGARWVGIGCADAFVCKVKIWSEPPPFFPVSRPLASWTRTPRSARSGLTCAGAWCRRNPTSSLSSETRMSVRGVRSGTVASGLAPLVVMSARQGARHTVSSRKGEAELFADEARARGVPDEALLLETRATNTGENVRFTRELLTARGLFPKKVLAVQKPYAERRVLVSLRRYWPGVAPAVTSRDVTLEVQCTRRL